MWAVRLALCFAWLLCSESLRRNALLDYEKSEGVTLKRDDKSLLMKSKQLSLVKCARRCNRNKSLPFGCRAFFYDRKLNRCSWLSFNTKTASVRKVEDFSFDLYEKKDYIRECIVGNGANYKGSQSATKTGLKCQAWSSMVPHEHSFLPSSYRNKDLQENYCRNPDNETSGPWCFTTDPDVRHQSCGIPQCSEVECMTCNGENYRGHVDHTESGKECQRWDLIKPHNDLFYPKRYPDKGLDDNYCRNPDNSPRPWCFTQDPIPQKEYCNIKVCDESMKLDPDITYKCFRGQGEKYRGTVNATPSGVKCQHWDSQFPHNHSYTPQNYKCQDLRENYCRNPDGAELPWCFTTDPNVRVAFCTHIPRCTSETSDTEVCYNGSGEDYRGYVSKTRSGIPCKLWDRSPKNKSNYADAGLEKAYCRNPDKDKHGPWCYTNNPSFPWDYCDIKRCNASSELNKETFKVVPQKSCDVHIKTTRVVGGGPVKIKEASWMVSIQKGNTHWCGGSLIREDWVLTARQCFSSCIPDLTEYTLWVGFLHLNETGREISNKQVLKISHLVCGPEGSNLVMLKLSKPALRSENVSNISLPQAECVIQENTNCTVYGWGETKGTGHDGIMKAVNLPIVGNDKCNEYHKGRITVKDSEICAGGKKDEGTCEKDHGGPLVCEYHEIKFLHGISVHGRGCGRLNRPGIFVRIAYYSHWIHKVYDHQQA
ncbi:hepatocyte growth factor [Erpetoichthys calabaricus]|uniref:hepatocyte growth factor n=1 Tax=Erpetoichthys calabaricus TaxID=27687 RepID=UPI0010A07B7A|nr:hepatocyte growth factor [Erpetoichthys calabaricus]